LKSKTFTLRCTDDQAAVIAVALQTYADAAYPAGGSECGQVAQQTLQETARLIARDAGGTSGAQIRRRQRSIVKAAVSWYFSAEGPGPETAAPQMLKLLD